jgi:hypothetical protein
MLKRIDLPVFSDDRGDLGVVEMNQFVDWEVKRFYYLLNVTKPRGSHCVIGEKKIYLVLKGSLVAKFFDGKEWTEFRLEGPNQAVQMEGAYWRDFVDFSEDCVLLAISNMNYEQDKYIMDFEQYQEYIANNPINA